MNHQQLALLSIGRALKDGGYSFVAPTPLTCGRVLSRARREGANPLIEVFGWNRPFKAGTLGEPYEGLLERAGLCGMANGERRSLVRFSTIGPLLFVHSGFPTDQQDAIFFGPDTYRFARAIKSLSEFDPHFSPQTIIDIGTGSGAGGLCAGSVFPNAARILLTDINPAALQFAQVNALLNDIPAETRHSDVLAQFEGQADLILSNPPYLVDASRRAYRHGGGDWGCLLAVRIVSEALDHLSNTGRLLLYTGTPVVEGADKFLEMVRPLLERRVTAYRYEELDPDVFGEELEKAPYDRADRIATVALHVKGADITR